MNSDKAISVAVTGAAGQISYSLLFRIASGAMFGDDQPVTLRLIEVEGAMHALEGVAMELDDCAFAMLRSIELTAEVEVGFDGANWALLVGAMPRKAGMERRDLLSVNGTIFGPQGRAISKVAASDVRVLVVGNPCNTNALIARSAAPDVEPDRFFSMMRLDQNRAMTQLAKAANVAVSEVSNVAVWGNHSATQFPDFTNAKIAGEPCLSAITNHKWLRDEFISSVQERGAAIIEARGASSAASAANGIVDSVRSILEPTPKGDCTSVAVLSRGEYGVPEGLQFGFPVASDGKTWSVVEGFALDDFARSKIALTTQELVGERAEITHLLNEI